MTLTKDTTKKSVFYEDIKRIIVPRMVTSYNNIKLDLIDFMFLKIKSPHKSL